MKNKLDNIAIRINNRAEKLAALYFLSGLSGKPVSQLVLENTLKDGPDVLCFSYVYVSGNSVGALCNAENHTVVNFRNMGELAETNLEIEVKLNDTHTAIVTADEIRVGCQTFKAGIITSLAAAWEKAKNS
jgi:hypothetical protein